MCVPTWKEHMRDSSTLIMPPALSNSPQQFGAEKSVTSWRLAKNSYPSSTTCQETRDVIPPPTSIDTKKQIFSQFQDPTLLLGLSIQSHLHLDQCKKRPTRSQSSHGQFIQQGEVSHFNLNQVKTPDVSVSNANISFLFFAFHTILLQQEQIIAETQVKLQ